MVLEWLRNDLYNNLILPEINKVIANSINKHYDEVQSKDKSDYDGAAQIIYNRYASRLKSGTSREKQAAATAQAHDLMILAQTYQNTQRAKAQERYIALKNKYYVEKARV